MSYTITVIKNTLKGISSTITEAEWIRALDDRMVGITAEEQNKDRRMERIEDSFRDVWDNIKCTRIWIPGVPEEEEKKTIWENLWGDYGQKLP